MGNLGDMDEEPHVLRVRGLPWSATASDIINFFGQVKILGGEDGIHMTLSREGRPSGEAYIEVESEDDVDLGVQKDKEVMGHRYIEVFKARKSEMEWVVKRNGLNVQSSMDDSCVRLRGLPFGCSKEDIAHFFTGLEIVPNGISLCTDMQGRQTGEAYVQFVNKEIAGKALQKHKERIGHRYIEIFRSSLSEIKAAMGPKIRPVMGFGNRPGPYDRGDRFGGPNRYVNMSQRGGRSFKGFSDFDDYYKNTWDLSHPQRMSESGMGMGGTCEDYLEEPGPGYSNGNGGNFSTGPVGGFCGRGDFPGNNRGGYTGMTRGGFSNVSRGGFSGETVGNYPGSMRGGYSTGGRGGYSGVNCAGLMEENHGPYPSSNAAGYSSDKMMGYSNARFGTGFPEKGFKGARHCVHMRGLPFRATEQDIVEFFKPIEPVMVNILYENNGRATGEADIDFGTHDDAVRAMSRDKARMQHRYIELFLNST